MEKRRLHDVIVARDGARIPLAALLLLLALALALGCARDPLEDLPAAVTPEAARLVSTVTSGSLPSRGAVRARFAGPMIDTSLAGHPLKKRVFAFTPAIDGTALWETTRDLVFRPDRPLPPRKSYRGRLDLVRPAAGPPRTPAPRLRLHRGRPRDPLPRRRLRPGRPPATRSASSTGAAWS